MTTESSNSKQNQGVKRRRRIKLNATVLRLAPLLANRDYRTRELVIDLRMEEDKKAVLRIREWCRCGLSHRHDATGHVLINGHDFAAWVREHNGRAGRSRLRHALPPGHMWCPGYNQPQPFDASSVSTDRSYGRVRRVALCPKGHRMSQWTPGRSA